MAVGLMRLTVKICLQSERMYHGGEEGWIMGEQSPLDQRGSMIEMDSGEKKARDENRRC